MIKIFLFFTLILGFYSCQNDGGGIKSLLPSSVGQIDDIVVVMDKNNWEDSLGAAFRKYFGSEFLILPQPEPVFKLMHTTLSQFHNTSMAKFSTIIIAGSFDQSSPVSKHIKESIQDESGEFLRKDSALFTYSNDVWAKPQLIIYLYAATQNDLINKLKTSHNTIKNRIYGAEHSRILKLVYHQGRNAGAEAVLHDKMGLGLQIPSDYKVTLSNDSVIWLRKETADISSNILLYQFPATDELKFDHPTAFALRNSLVKMYITTQIKGSYMKTDTSVYPVVQQDVTFYGNPSIITKGLWHMHNDFMGGPFINYLIHDEKKERWIMMDGFVHAPKLDKKHLVRQLMAIFKSLDLQQK